MSWELVYTSVPQGLKPGSRGFCPVAMTRGIPAVLLERLESLSGYRHLFAPQDPNARLNPPAWSHLIANLGGKRYHLLSYVGDAGLDYSQRTNKLAHHVACEPMELTPAGPAGCLQQPGFLLTKWQSEPAQWPAGRAIPRTETRPGPCATWQRVAGDAGWAGILAETIFTRRDVNVIFQPGTPVLNLFAEAIALLPPPKRWEATFQTFYTGLPQGIDCRWRGIVAGSEEETLARRNTNALLIDLTRPQAAPASAASQAAREGRQVEPLRTLEQAAPAPRSTGIPQAQPAPQPHPGQRPRSMQTVGPQPDLHSYELQPLDGVPAGPPGMSPMWDPSRAQRVNRGKTWMIVAAVAGLVIVLATGGVGYYIVSKTTSHQEESKQSTQSQKQTPLPEVKAGDTKPASPMPSKSPSEEKLEKEDAELQTDFSKVKDELQRNTKPVENLHALVVSINQNLIKGDSLEAKLESAKALKKLIEDFQNDSKNLSPTIYPPFDPNKYNEEAWSRAGLSREQQVLKMLSEIKAFISTKPEERLASVTTTMKQLESDIQAKTDDEQITAFLGNVKQDLEFIKKDQGEFAVVNSPLSVRTFNRIRIDLINSEKAYSVKVDGNRKILVKDTPSSPNSEIAEFILNPQTNQMMFRPKLSMLGHKPALAAGLFMISDTKGSDRKQFVAITKPNLVKNQRPQDLNLESTIDLQWDYTCSSTEGIKIEFQFSPEPNKWQSVILEQTTAATNPKGAGGKRKETNSDTDFKNSETRHEITGMLPHDDTNKRFAFHVLVRHTANELKINSTAPLLMVYPDKKLKTENYHDLNSVFNFSRIGDVLTSLKEKKKPFQGNLNRHNAQQKLEQIRGEITTKKASKKSENDDSKKRNIQSEIDELEKVELEYGNLLKLDDEWPIEYYKQENYLEQLKNEIRAYLATQKVEMRAFRMIKYTPAAPNGQKLQEEVLEVPLQNN